LYRSVGNCFSAFPKEIIHQAGEFFVIIIALYKTYVPQTYLTLDVAS
jgi:hypothetical protein